MMTSDLVYKRKITKSKVIFLVITFVIFVFSFSFIFPFIWLTYTAFKPESEFIMSTVALPEGFYFGNIINIFSRPDMATVFLNSAFNSLISVFFVVAIAFILGYVLARFHFRGRGVVYGFFLAGMIVPIHALLIPIFIQFRNMSMLDNRFTLIMPYIAFSLPVAMYLYDSFIRSIPKEIDEATFMDGGSYINIMARILFPICRPITATVLILSFLSLWNEFPFALVLITSSQLRTVPIWLTFFRGQYLVNIPLQLTAMLVASLPVVILFLVFKNRIMEGMAAGAIKG